uniref:Uncharacterized protein n=1 Tax=Chromera velia CCMP2878 TaxID=1169474 RepID=A0A0G4HFM1_9ALVE|eukprot:Cvel_27123.t1-p1 / transcript=Cvel_27123.t1 / gene=Cvel_27123 / organism=Chromera_velia_CCMP2878 / gene_product=hypothetical protein / transcript_product=hypothetical protein / location=Cvel_scaffold3329:11624-12323(-) / protein_length=167 / sequence_SO=supercontig / SO=protein_coding / is_pseudo=false
MVGKTNCNSFATVSHLEPNPAAVAAAIRVTGEFKSVNYVDATGNPPLNHGGRGGRGGNVGKGKVGHFERAYPDIRRKHAKRGRVRGRGGGPPARGGTQVEGQRPAPHVASYMCNYSVGPFVPPGYSAMMTAPSFPFMKALGDVENPTFRVGEVLGKAEEGTHSGDSW